MGSGDVVFAQGYLRIIHCINLNRHSLTTRPRCGWSLCLMAELATQRHLGSVLQLFH